MDWLRLYLTYTKKQESPELFHLWSALTLIGTALGRKCFMRRGYYDIYPNLFTILVAGSAECRKSTAIEIGIRLLNDIPNLVGDIPSIKVFDGKISPEKMIRDLAECSVQVDGKWISPSVLVWADELSVFLSKQSYAEPMIHILTRLFACPEQWSYKTKNRGEDILHNVFLCILAATTPPGVARGIPESAMSEGWGARSMFIFQDFDPNREDLFPEITAEMLDMHLQLKKGLADIALMHGEFTLTNEARKWAEGWYHDHRRTPPRDPRLAGMHGRKHDHMFRLGMMFAASEGSTIVHEGHCDAAIAALDTMEIHAPLAFSEIGADNTTAHIMRAVAFLRRFKRVGYSEFLKKMHPVNADGMKVVLETLIQRGQVRRALDNNHLLEWLGD